MDWNAAGAQAGDVVWRWIGIVGPAIFTALLAALIVRAVVQHRRYRAVGTFTDDDRRAVREAIAASERKTVGEILPVVVERSDPHPAADWLAALLCLLIGTSLLAPWLPWEHPVYLIVAQLAIGAAGFGLARLLPGFKRAFIAEDRATSVAMEQAFQEFYANGLHRTAASTGVLVFVSLLERRAIVLGDEGIDAKVERGAWAGTNDLILEGIRRGSLRDGLVAGIRQAGDLLSRHFPWQEGDRNEIPDRVIVRRE